MKRWMALALILALAMGFALAEERDYPLGLPEGVKWGASSQALTAKLGEGFIKGENGEGLTALAAEEATVEGVKAALTYCFYDDRLIAWDVLYDEADMPEARLRAMLEERFGAGKAVDAARFVRMAQAIQPDALLDEDDALVAQGYSYEPEPGVLAGMVAENGQVEVAAFAEALIFELKNEPPMPSKSDGNRHYDEMYAARAMNDAEDAFLESVLQCGDMEKLRDCARTQPDQYWEKMGGFRSDPRGTANALGLNAQQQDIDLLLNSGDVMPWSELPMDRERFLELVGLCASRRGEYIAWAEALGRIAGDEALREAFYEDYDAALGRLLDVDEDITAVLYATVYLPHFKGQFAVEMRASVLYDKLQEMKAALRGNHLDRITDTEPEALAARLEALRAERAECVAAIGEIEARLSAN